MKFIISLLIILYLNFINCTTVYFNNTLTKQCSNIMSPCDLSSSQYWSGPISPGDDLIVDLSKNLNTFYLNLNESIIQLNSINITGNIIGPSTSNINLFFINSNLNVTSYFNILMSNILISNSTINLNQFNCSRTQFLINGQTNFNTNILYFNMGNVTIGDDSSFIVVENSYINTYIEHTSSKKLIFSGYSYITSGIYSTGLVFILSNEGNTSVIEKVNKYNNFNISSLVVSGNLLFKGDGNNWRSFANTINIGNITILTENTTITIDTTVFTLYGYINDMTTLYYLNFDIEYSSITIPSGFTIHGDFDSYYKISSILIFEGNLTTYFVNGYSPYLDITSDESSYIIYNSTLGNVGTTGDWVNISESSTLESILCVSCNVYIAELQTLNILEYLYLYDNVTVDGVLNLYNNAYIEANYVIGGPNSKINLNDNVKATVIANNLEFTNQSTIFKPLLITENGFLTIDSKGLYFKDNLTLSSNSTLTINNYYLYNNAQSFEGSASYNNPVITMSGSVFFDSISVVISFNEPTYLYNNISIVLLQILQNSTSQIYINNLDSINIDLINISNLNDISPKINFVVQDNTLRLEFDNNTKNTDSSKWKIAFIICATFAGVFAIAFVIVLVLKIRLNKFNGEYQRLINSNRNKI